MPTGTHIKSHVVKSVNRRHASRGFTLLESIAIGMAMGVMGASLAVVGPRHAAANQLKCATQVRGVVQSLVIWAQNNQDKYPLPSQLDTADATVKLPASSKDTLGNAMSLLIFNGMISPELVVSPAESNPAIQKCTDYQYANPAAAVQPANALWDPAFRATPDDESPKGHAPAKAVGYCSYASVVFLGERRAKQWSDTYAATEAIFGNRGPTYVQSDFAAGQANWKLLDGPLGAKSHTLAIHGGPNSWEGNIGYNDGHVQFETQPNPDTLHYAIDAQGHVSKFGDNLFVSETDEFNADKPGEFAKSLNMFLRPIAKVSAKGAPTLWRD